jgi:hypothetical protein
MMSLVGEIFKPYHLFTAENWVDETMEIGGANYDKYAYVIWLRICTRRVTDNAL